MQLSYQDQKETERGKDKKSLTEQYLPGSFSKIFYFPKFFRQIVQNALSYYFDTKFTVFSISKNQNETTTQKKHLFFKASTVVSGKK